MKPLSKCLRYEDCFETLKEARGEIRRLCDNNIGAVKDANRFRHLCGLVEGMKWADFLPSLRPEDEKYITPANLRNAIDQAIRNKNAFGLSSQVKAFALSDLKPMNNDL